MSYLVKLSFDPKKRYCRILADDGIHGLMNSQGPYRWYDSVSGVIDRNDPYNDGRWFEVRNLSLATSGKFYRLTGNDIIQEVQPSPSLEIGPLSGSTPQNNQPTNSSSETQDNAETDFEYGDSDFISLDFFDEALNLDESLFEDFNLNEQLSRSEMISEMEDMGFHYNWKDRSYGSIYNMYLWALEKSEKDKLNYEYDLYMRELERDKEPSNYIVDMPDADDYYWVSAYNNYDIYYNTKTDEYKIDGLKATYPTEQEAEEAIKDMEESY